MKKTVFQIVLSLAIITLLITPGKSQNNTLDFDGMDDDISINYNPALDFSLTSVFTIEAWFRTNAVVAVIYSNHIDQSPFIGHEVGIYQGKVFFDVTNDHFTNSLRVETSTAYNDGQWHHVACVYFGNPSANTVKMYIDGALHNHVITHNNLSLPVNTGNSNRIGSRHSMAYFFPGNIDEVRVWGRALCGDEIAARKNCHLSGNEPNLLAYYPFNQGQASGNNSSVNFLTDASGNNNTGTLNNFALMGSASNWINSTNGVTGTCTPFTASVTISGNTVSCKGNTLALNASGAASYTWSPGNQTGAQIIISPTVTSTYTLKALTTGSCQVSIIRTQSVSACVGLSAENQNDLLFHCFPNPVNDKLNIRNLNAGGEVEVVNALGQRVLHYAAVSESAEINLSDMPAGVYFLRYSFGKQATVVRIIKQ